jgi:hypothetical protein
MISRQPASRWAAWAFAVALLLKAAVPLLATASAHVQGKSLVEVCTVYGVATVAVDERQGGAPPSEHGLPHAAGPCALGALVALAAPVAAPVRSTVPARAAALPSADSSSTAPDACSVWVARLKHGPPARG